MCQKCKFDFQKSPYRWRRHTQAHSPWLYPPPPPRPPIEKSWLCQCDTVYGMYRVVAIELGLIDKIHLRILIDIK